MKTRDKNLPNLLSSLRIIGAPFLILTGWLNHQPWFLGLFAFLLITDFLDGFIARRHHIETQLGAQLDTAGDVLISICIILGGYLLAPELAKREAIYFLAVLILLGLSGAIALFKHGHLPSYHTWSAKAATALIGVAAWFLFAGFTPWIFRSSIFLLAYSSLEGIGITFTLRNWRTDIPTFAHARRIRYS